MGMGAAMIMGIFAIITATMGIIGNGIQSGISNKQNRKNAEDIAKLNYMYNEMSADEAQQRQEDTYKSLYSPPAQMEMLKEAGLSPGLLYSGQGSGVGNAYGAQGAGAAGQHINPMQLFDINGSLQSSNVMSQIELNKALAKKYNVEAENEEEWYGKEKEATIANLAAQTENTKVKTIGERLDNSIKELDKFIKEMTTEDEIDQIRSKTKYYREEAEDMITQVKRHRNDFEYEKSVYPKLLRQQDLKNQNLFADTLLKGAQKQLTEEEAKKVREDIKINWIGMCMEVSRSESFNDYMSKMTEYIPKYFGLEVSKTAIKGVRDFVKIGIDIYKTSKGLPSFDGWGDDWETDTSK